MDEPMGCYDDFEHANALILWGSNMAEMHPRLWARIEARKLTAPDTRVINLSVFSNRSSLMADRKVIFHPQSDLAIANGVARLLVERSAVNTEFMQAHTLFKAAKSSIGYGLEDEFAFAGDPGVKVMSLWTMGVNQHTRGTWMNNLIYNLHLLTGKISEPGNSPFSLMGQPSACGTTREVGTFAHRLPADMVVANAEHRGIAEKMWGVPAGTISGKVGYNAVEMVRALDRSDVKVFWSLCANLFQDYANLGRYHGAAQWDDAFIIVSDVYPNRSTELADVILPTAMWAEEEGAYGPVSKQTDYKKCAVKLEKV